MLKFIFLFTLSITISQVKGKNANKDASQTVDDDAWYDDETERSALKFQFKLPITDESPYISIQPICTQNPVMILQPGKVMPITKDIGNEQIVCEMIIKSSTGEPLRMYCPISAMSQRGCNRERLIVNENEYVMCGNDGLPSFTTEGDELFLHYFRAELNAANGEHSSGFMCFVTVEGTVRALQDKHVPQPEEGEECTGNTARFGGTLLVYSDLHQDRRDCRIAMKGPKDSKIYGICLAVISIAGACKRERIVLKGDIAGITEKRHEICAPAETRFLFESNKARIIHKRKELNVQTGEGSEGFICAFYAVNEATPTAEGPLGADRPFCPNCGESNVGTTPRKPHTRVVSGEEVAQGEFPFIVQVHIETVVTDRICSGSIIKPNWILTAAHCLDDVAYTAVTIVVGEISLTAPSTRLTIQRIVIHEHHNPSMYTYDAALLELTAPLIFSQLIQPACLGLREDYMPETPVVVAGWGKIIGDPAALASDILRKVALIIVPNNVCTMAYLPTFAITEDMVCAWDTGNVKTACFGDSGSPLMVEISVNKWAIVGLVSFGHEGCDGSPTLYTRTELITDWIREVTGGNSC